jgi:flagellar basal body P-ring formation protein FlgA
MMFRQLLIAAALLAGCTVASAADSDLDAIIAQAGMDAAATTNAGDTPQAKDVIAQPVLRESIRVTSDIVRIGDLIDNAGALGQIPVYRAPDLGTTGTLSTTEVLATLRNNQVYGVDTHGITEVTVTRLSRSLTSKDIEQRVARTLERRYGLGAASSLAVTFDRDLGTLQLDASNSGDLRASAVHYDARTSRFDILFEIINTDSSIPTRLRFTGSAVETVEAAVLTRGVEVNEVLKSSDVITERRPKNEVGNDPASRDRAVGMQARRAMHAGQALRAADLGNPDLVQRDQSITLVYDNDGIYLTVRAKALEAGTMGDQVSVMNPQSKRTVQGVVTGPAQVSVVVTRPRAIADATADPSTRP